LADKIYEEKIPKRMLTVGEKEKLLVRFEELQGIIRNN